MDSTLNELDSKDGTIVESNKNSPKLSDDKTNPDSSLASERSETIRPISSLAKTKANSSSGSASTSSSTAKSKIPAIKRQPNTSLSMNNKTASQSSDTTGGATQRTVSSISSAKQNNTAIAAAAAKKTETSISKTSSVAKTLNSNHLKTLQNSEVSGLQRSGIQKRTDSNMSPRRSSSAPKPETETGKLRKIASTAGDQNKMNILEKKLIDIQTEFLKTYETMKSANPTEKMQKEYKFITLIRNDACKIMIKDDQLKKMPQKLPANSVGDFKEKIKMSLTDRYTAIMCDVKEFSENPEEQENRLLKIKDASIKEICALVDDLCVSYKKDDTNDTPEIVRLQEDLQKAKESLKLAETKLIKVNKENEEKLAQLESNTKTKASEELTSKEEQIKDLQKKLKSLEKQNDALKEDLMVNANLQEELKSSRENYNVIQKKLSTSDQLLSNERNDLKSKNEIIKKLESEMAALNNKMDDMKTEHKTDDKASEYLRQITELRNTNLGLENEKSSLEKKIQDLISQTSSNNDLRVQLRDAEIQIEDLQHKLAESERPTEPRPEGSNDAQMELEKLRQSESEKTREIEKLTVQLSKALVHMKQLMGEIQRDEQLLEVLSELIKSLQTNETDLRIQIDDLFAQIAEKTFTVNELNNKLHVESNGYRELFSTINCKQEELLNKTRMIKLLKEGDERNQMLHVKQEEKISHMVGDIAHLKQTIAIYQANILSGNPKLVYQPIMPPLNEGYNENFYYYTSQSKHERQIDIIEA